MCTSAYVCLGKVKLYAIPVLVGERVRDFRKFSPSNLNSCFRQQPFVSWTLLNFEQAVSLGSCLTAIENRQPRFFWRKWKNNNFVCSWSNIFYIKNIIETEDEHEIDYRDFALSVRIEKKCFTEFCCGHKSTSDAESLGGCVYEEAIRKMGVGFAKK